MDRLGWKNRRDLSIKKRISDNRKKVANRKT